MGDGLSPEAERACVKDDSAVLHPLPGFDDSTCWQQGLVARPTWTEAEGDVLRDAANRLRLALDDAHWMTQGASSSVSSSTAPSASTRPSQKKP